MSSTKEDLKKFATVWERHRERDLLSRLWKCLTCKVHASEHAVYAEADLRKIPVIHVYPAAPNKGEIARTEQLLRAFGQVLSRFGDAEFQRTWKYKLQLPFKEDIRLAQEKLDSEDVRRVCRTYRDVVETYPNRGSSLPRLVFVHIANALLANGVPYSQSRGINLAEWGATSEYCLGRKRHSLIPLLSAHAPREVHLNFEHAFQEWVLRDLVCIRDSSVARAARYLVRDLVAMTDPGRTGD